jgi:hypothetical protein
MSQYMPRLKHIRTSHYLILEASVFVFMSLEAFCKTEEEMIHMSTLYLKKRLISINVTLINVIGTL